MLFCLGSMTTSSTVGSPSLKTSYPKAFIMVQTTAIHRPFHLQLLLRKVSSGQVINFEFVEYIHGQQTLHQQNLMSLGAETELPEICNEKDVTIAVLEGQGNLEDYSPRNRTVYLYSSADVLHAADINRPYFSAQSLRTQFRFTRKSLGNYVVT